MTPDHQGFRDIIEKIRRLAEIGPQQTYMHGVSLSTLQMVNPFLDNVELQAINVSQASEILLSVWSGQGYEFIQNPNLAIEAFVFSRVFGESVSAWLLSEAVRLPSVDRSYVMTEPMEGMDMKDTTLKYLTKDSAILDRLRRLHAGYVGWLGRSK